MQHPTNEQLTVIDGIPCGDQLVTVDEAVELTGVTPAELVTHLELFRDPEPGVVRVSTRALENWIARQSVLSALNETNGCASMRDDRLPEDDADLEDERAEKLAELNGKRGLFWYASQDKPIRRGSPAEQLDAEMKAAQKLGVESSVIVTAAYHLWGRTLTEERDRAAKAGKLFDRMAKEYYGDEAGTPTARTLQARRGHITRQLVDQIEQLLRDPSFDSSDRHGWRRAFRAAGTSRQRKAAKK